MPRPSRWAVALVLAAGATLGASTTLLGCSSARGCLTGCNPGDAGPDGQAHGSGLKDTCPIVRACPHVRTVSSVSTLSLSGSGTAYLGNAIETQLGPAVSFVVVPSQPGALRRIGVALLEQQQVIGLTSTSSGSDPTVAPVLLERDGELDLLEPPTFDQLIPIQEGTLQPGAALPIVVDPLPGSVPAAVGFGQALAAVVDPGPTLRFYDATLGKPLLTTALGNGSAVQPLALTPSCNGLMASWGSKVAAFTPLGDRVAPTVDTGLPAARHAVWDGGELVLSGSGGVVELDSKGNVLSRTQVPMGAAVGTDDGLLAISDSVGSSEVVVRNRSSGSVDKSYATLSKQLVPEAVVVTNRYVYFMQAASTSLLWVDIVCSA